MILEEKDYIYKHKTEGYFAGRYLPKENKILDIGSIDIKYDRKDCKLISKINTKNDTIRIFE